MEKKKIDFHTLHEGFFKDIFDFITDPLESDLVHNIKDRIFGVKDPNRIEIKHNLADSAKGLTATFPVIVTEATQVEHAVMISKAIERKAMALLQMLFAANQISNATNAKSYLRNFHHNIDTSIDISGMDVDDVIEYTNELSESIRPENLEYKAMVNQAIEFVYEDTKRNIHHVLNGDLNTVAINEYMCTGNIQEAEVWRSDSSTTRTTYEKDDPNVANGHKKIEKIEQISDNPNIGDIKNSYEIISKGILKTDVAKANEAVPSLMIVNFVSIIPGVDGSNGHKIVSTAVIGVKAVLHYVSSEDMINHMIMKNNDKNGLFNLIRATTREISFFKDFLFAIDRAKVDAVGRSGKGSNNKLWKILELRADQAKFNKNTGKNNTDCAAITSLIVNKSEVDLIKKYHRIDLSKPGQFLSIMRGYNLMCGIIIDEVAEKVDFLFDDSDKNFETLSFMSLERDSDSGQLKKIINVMAAKGR